MARKSMRAEIVEAGLAQFRERGYGAAGVKDITDRAGVPKGSFYNHFESKEALALVALERYGAELRLADLEDAEVEPLLRLRRHFEFLRDGFVQVGFTRGCLIGNFGTEVADHSEPIRSAVKQALASWTGLIRRVLTEAQQTGSLREGLDPAAAARFLVNAWEGTLIQMRADRAGTGFDAFFAIAFDSLLPPEPTTTRA